MSPKEIRTKARELGTDRIAALTSTNGEVVSRYLSGAVNPDLQGQLKRIWVDNSNAG